MKLLNLPVTSWLLIDALGALLTATTHGILLRRVLPFTGMPDAVLSLLAIAAAGLAIYSIMSWLLSSRGIISTARASQLLRIVALANLLFVLALGVLLLVFRDSITGLGWLYFLVEVLVVLLLVNVEWRVGLRVLRRASDSI